MGRGRLLVSQEHICSEDEGSGDEDVLMDVWAYSRKDMIKNEVTQNKVGVASVVDNIR